MKALRRANYLSLGILIFLDFASGHSLVSLGKQGYSNLLVRISDDIPSAICLDTIASVQELFEEASGALCNALDNRAFFGDVTIMIPDHWEGNCLKDVINITWPRAHTADVILSQDDPVFGNQSLTLQHGGCGIDGLPIRLPLGFLSGSTRGAAMVHEWFHYRYGVFDESGVIGDPLFPNGYQISQPGAEIMLTSCTNVPLNGQWIEEEWQFEGDNSIVTSSIMFSTKLESINRPCTVDNHLKAPPTKHNWLCGGRSVSEIVKKHRDFNEFNQTKTCAKTRFNVVANPHKGYHIIIDKSSAMGGPTDLLKSATFAVSHFVWFLPDGSFVSIDTFDSNYGQLQKPIELNLTNKNVIMESLRNLKAETGNSDGYGLGIALNNAIRMFKLGYEIILVTATETVPNDYNNLVSNFHLDLVSPHILALGSRACNNIFSTLARDGWLHFVPSWNTTAQQPGSKIRNGQAWMIDTLHSIYSRTRKYRPKVEEKTLLLNEFESNNGTFQLDSNGTNLLFAFYDLDGGHGMNFITGQLVHQQSNVNCVITGPNLYTNVALYSANCSNKIIQEGIWSYEIKMYGSSTVRLDIWFESSNAVKIESWTSSFQNNAIDWISERVVIYASVFLQHRAVSNTSLNIIAYIVGDNSADEILTVNLTENDPSDITKGDGIYSAMLTSLPQNSISFTYVVEIIDGNGTVDSGTYEGNHHPMAGSSIPVNNPTALSTSFNRYVYGASFQLSQLNDGQNVLPPARVTDLKISNFDSMNSTVELHWTAPKDDYGASALVEIFIISEEDTLAPGKEFVSFNGTIHSLPGSLDHMAAIVAMTTANQSRNIYYRVYAVDESGNRAESSNIATLFVPGASSETGGNSVLPPALFWFLIGLGCLCLILIATIIGICIKRRREKKKREDVGADWVQIGETTIEVNKTPENKKDAAEPKIPDFNLPVTPIARRRSSSLDVSEGGYSVGSEIIYQRPYVISTLAEIETSRNNFDDANESVRRTIPSYSFGSVETSPPTSAGFTSPKKTPPPPPIRKYYPYSPASSLNNNSRDQFGRDNVPLASSPSYFASQIKKDLYEKDFPKTYSMRTLTSASNSSMSRFGIIIGADSEASLV